jgi:hypothetical protein
MNNDAIPVCQNIFNTWNIAHKKTTIEGFLVNWNPIGESI